MPAELAVTVASGLGIWLLGVSYAAGVAVQRSRDNTRRLDEQNRVLERLARIEGDVAWIKRYLNGGRQE